MFRDELLVMLLRLYTCTTIFTNFSFIPVYQWLNYLVPFVRFGRQCTEEIFPVLAIKPVLPSFFVSREETSRGAFFRFYSSTCLYMRAYNSRV